MILRKACLSDRLFTTNTTWTGLESNTGLHSGRLVTKSLSHSMAPSLFSISSSFCKMPYVKLCDLVVSITSKMYISICSCVSCCVWELPDNGHTHWPKHVVKFRQWGVMCRWCYYCVHILSFITTSDVQPQQKVIWSGVCLCRTYCRCSIWGSCGPWGWMVCHWPHICLGFRSRNPSDTVSRCKTLETLSVVWRLAVDVTV